MDQYIFISYRRVDSEGYAGWIYDRLQECFGVERVFMDFTNIGVGDDFIDAIDQAISTCKVVVVLINPEWHSILDEMGRKRLDDPHDFVRAEVQAALARDIQIVPVLIQGAKMPTSEELPFDLNALSRCKPIEIRQRHFDTDVDLLISELEYYLGKKTNEVQEAGNKKPIIRLLNCLGFVFVAVIFCVITIYVWYSRDDLTGIGTPVLVNSTLSSSTSTVIQTVAHTATQKPSTETAKPSTTLTPTITNSPTIRSTQTPKSTPTDSFLQKEIIDPFDSPMVLVPQGPFVMGTDNQEPWDLNANPARIVGLDMFYIDKFEVSNVQYEACVISGECKEPKRDRSKTRSSYFDDRLYADYPVIYVSWQDANNFCSWRGGRLPDEAEWEKAARGEETSNYPWGEDSIDCQHANFRPGIACKGDTNPVDSQAAGSSPYGVLNMSGNVQEWVNDWFRAYPGGDRNATNDFGITHKVIRGGAYFDGQNYVMVTTRKGMNPESAYSYVGFRCVIDIDALP